MKLLSSISTIIFILILLAPPTSAQDSLQYGPDYYEIDPELKHELNLVYVGASWCPPCRTDSLKQVLEDIKITLYKRAQKLDMNYSVIGVANDQSIQKGWDLLNSSGYFDEIVIGKKWVNSGSIEFIWNHQGVKPGVPQIIVFRRPLEFGKRINVGKKEILVRKMGNEIYDWFRNGSPLQQ